MRHRSFFGLFGLLAVIMAGCIIFRVYDSNKRAAVVTGPVMECPGELNLGLQENYQVARGKLVIANRGDEPLHIGEVRTSCTCTGLEQEGTDGQLTKVTTVTIPPGCEKWFTVRQAINGRVGEPVASSLHFQTNDPACLEKRIVIAVPTVTGGVETGPRQVVFGDVRVGRTAATVVDVIDRSAFPRRVAKVISRMPSKVTATLLPPPPKVAVGSPAAELGGTVIARVEVRLNTDEDGPLDAQIEVLLEGSEKIIPTIIVVKHASSVLSNSYLLRSLFP